MKFYFLVIALTCFLNVAQASSFQGYKKQTQEQTMVFVEQVDRFIETPSDFLILLSHHAAFYRFPKTEYAADIRDFLTSRKNAHRMIKVTFDPTSTEILLIEDAPQAK